MFSGSISKNLMLNLREIEQNLNKTNNLEDLLSLNGKGRNINPKAFKSNDDVRLE
jgi:hypothetical protein